MTEQDSYKKFIEEGYEPPNGIVCKPNCGKDNCIYKNTLNCKPFADNLIKELGKVGWNAERDGRTIKIESGNTKLSFRLTWKEK